jgi:hypothetical protein
MEVTLPFNLPFCAYLHQPDDSKLITKINNTLQEKVVRLRATCPNRTVTIHNAAEVKLLATSILRLMHLHNTMNNKYTFTSVKQVKCLQTLIEATIDIVAFDKLLNK